MLLGRILGESGVPTALSQIERWSTQWSWVERCDDWDREQDRGAREEHQAAIAEARRVEAMAGTLLLGTAIRRLSGATDIREGEEVVVQPLDLNKTSASDVVRLADAGAKLLGKGLAIASTDFQNVARSRGLPCTTSRMTSSHSRSTHSRTVCEQRSAQTATFARSSPSTRTGSSRTLAGSIRRGSAVQRIPVRGSRTPPTSLERGSPRLSVRIVMS